MAEHNVTVSLPWHELGKADARFEIYKDGEKFGRITISKGLIEWFPRGKKKGLGITWTAFDKLIKEYHGK